MSGSTHSSGDGYARALAIAAVAIGADQLTKALVRGALAPGEGRDFLPGVDLVRVANDGIAFGLFNEAGSVVLVIATLAFAALLGFFLARGDRPGVWLPTGLIIGGAVGNLIDRVREGFVTDFLDPPRWPAFNIADVEITVGVVILTFIYMREPAEPAEPSGPSESAEPAEPAGASGSTGPAGSAEPGPGLR